MLREIMARETVDKDGNPTGETVGEQFLWQILNHAIRDGNPSLVRELMDRHDGKVSEPPGEGPDAGNARPDPTDMLIPDHDDRHDDPPGMGAD